MFRSCRRRCTRKREVLSESRMREICLSGCVSSEGWHVRVDERLEYRIDASLLNAATAGGGIAGGAPLRQLPRLDIGRIRMSSAGGSGDLPPPRGAPPKRATAVSAMSVLHTWGATPPPPPHVPVDMH